MAESIMLSVVAERLPNGAERVGPDVPISGVTHDSRMVESGDLFVAIPGEISDGHDFLDMALSKGAAAAIVEHSEAAPSRIVVPDARAALPWAAAVVYGEPSSRIPVIGVTGTNGKTTVTHLVEQMLVAAGRTAAIVGTVGARIGEQARSVARTTPEASDLQRLLADMVVAGVDVAAIEVSSHAIELHRVDAIHFRVAAFTNLTEDHLDFHGDMETYFATKARLFTPDRAEHAVISIDDPAGFGLAGTADLPVTSVGLDKPADITATGLVETIEGSRFVVETATESFPVVLPLPGRFNIQNALVAIGIARELGLTASAIAEGLSSIGEIPGRFERLKAPNEVTVVVDYAHTPDAVEAVVGSARRIATRRVIVVFGAGGDRDRDKRPAMGRAAGQADLAVLTSDNPRSEDPLAIMTAVKAGMSDATSVVEEPDRRAAIAHALREARRGDLVLVLGKGHETGQEVDGVIEPFDDRGVILEELEMIVGEAS
ncbi:MAG: UDP-N-acetylmuramoyl-L-alanyl-D-glutamate--2,6-diaminopimelate ligase [Actinomycetota bacterium]